VAGRERPEICGEWGTALKCSRERKFDGRHKESELSGLKKMSLLPRGGEKVPLGSRSGKD